MSFSFNYANLHLQSSYSSPKSLSFFHKPLRIREFRVWRRRRLKLGRSRLAICSSHLGPLASVSFENLFHSLISQFPSVNSLDLIAPALGVASGIALYLSRFSTIHDDFRGPDEIGDWILVTSPTPFNRFVLLRCPSISFEGSELLQDLNEKLVKEDRHFLKLSSGKIRVPNFDDGCVKNLVYQRVCISADDGGVISLDWPANLDLTEEHGMDTTLLLVPGTVEGSADWNVKSFVCDSLRRGFFPVVMNPRGCAGSPITTARLFTAADSDDVCTAIQFINKARSWTTLMGVGWGHGANMLTKYLAEVGERTPFTAAACIDNPFDLEEATRSLPHHIAVDQKLTSGLIEILRSNKELFQGRAKGFNVEKALSATSLRDFEKEISMVSYGFDDIADFYSKSSTRKLIGNVKVPVLFIQSNDGTVPPFSIPRSSIVANPFTSLLLCSCLHSSISISERSIISWCQHFSIEWLTAVELGLLKGRHPLLKDVDITVNPSKGLALAEGRESDNNSDAKTLLHLNKLDTFNGFPVDPIKDKLNGRNAAANVPLRSWVNILKSVESDQPGQANMLSQKSGVDAELFKEEGDVSVNIDKSQGFQTAQVVMNMLDVTMPGALGKEQKKKVLTAMEQGETLIRALEAAVPEDVRGKLTAAVSGIVQAQGTNFSLDGIMKVGQIANASPEGKLKIQEALRGLSSAAGGHKDVYSSGQMQKGGDQSLVGVDSNQSSMEKPAEGLEPESPPSQVSQKSLDQSQTQPESSHGGNIPASGRKDANESEKNYVKGEFSREEAAQTSKNDETDSGTEGNSNKHGKTDKKAGSEDIAVEQDGDNQANGVAKTNVNLAKDIHFVEEQRADPSTEQNKPSPTTRADDKSIEPSAEQNKPSSTTKADDKSIDPSTERNKPSPTTRTDEPASCATSTTEPSLAEKEGNDVQKGEDKITQPMEGQNKHSSAKSDESVSFVLPPTDTPSIGVSQALDALTNFDDSTQIAVNSVFGVIENMIAQFAEDNEHGNEEKENVADDDNTSASEETPTATEIKYKMNREDCTDVLNIDSALLQTNSHPIKDICDETRDHQDGKNGSNEEQLSQSCNSSFEESNGKEGVSTTMSNHVKDDEKMRMKSLVSPKSLVEGSDKFGNDFPLCMTVNPHGDILYNECLHQYLLSKVSNEKSLDIDSTADLLLDYIPEEGQWKLLDQPGNTGEPLGNIDASKTVNGSEKLTNSPSHGNCEHEAIEPSYIILDTGNEWQPVEEYKTVNNLIQKSVRRSVWMAEQMPLIRNVILDSLKVEVDRRLGFDNVKDMDPNLTQDLEKVADAVAVTVGHSNELSWPLGSKASASGMADTLHGEHIMETISSAVKDATYLRKVLPIGVIVGSTLASLRNYFNILEQQDNGNVEDPFLNQANNISEHFDARVSEMENGRELSGKKGLQTESDSSANKVIDKHEGSKNNTVMAGAVTAALGASALLVHQQRKSMNECNQTTEVSSVPHNEKGTHMKEHDKLLDAMSEKNQSNIVTSLAEKAMSVAGPVVPTNSDGEVDQERLVAMLADWGQKGGMLRLVGKVALLWGGIRGAMSLTDKLISFSRIAERPLYQRIFGFACMVLVLWSPVVIPLFPTLVQSWATHNSNGITEYACIMGLYIAVTILIMLWGKRIRGYNDPMEQYGLDLASLPKLLDFLKGLIGGVMLVSSVHSINALLGYARFSWPWALHSSSPDALARLKVYGGIIVLACRGIVTAAVVSVVEELLFRSWLPEEIVADLGHHWAIMISGLAFAILQRYNRSLLAIPGLWLLALILSGIRQRSEGSLSIPIGIRTGILASSFVLQTGGFLTYRPNCAIWLIGTHPLQPFGGVIGQAICLVLAILLYPRQPLRSKRVPRVID